MQRFVICLSATNGNRLAETVIKVERKPTSGLKHIGRYSMTLAQMRQGGVFHFPSFVLFRFRIKLLEV
jgi:hypothetical protein